jgi:antitoxin ChpS
MHIARLRQVGGSLMVAIPPGFLDQLELKARSEVALSIEGDRLIITRGKPRYSHAELLAMGPPPPVTEADTKWVGSAPVGSELI